MLNEQISEADVLGGLLVHSADNYADLLATWDAGSIPAFVAKMNAAAARLGMDHSHFADASGVNPGSESTASDLLKVAALDMANPTFAGFVQQSSVTLPVAGTISTYTPLLGVQGVIGVKSGFTSQAGGGDVLAVDRTVDGKQVLLLSAVTGQTGPVVLAQAGLHALALVDAMTPFIGSTEVLAQGHLSRPTSARRGPPLTPRPRRRRPCSPGPGSLRRASSCRRGTCPSRPAGGRRSGTSSSPLGTQRVAVPVQLVADIPPQSLLQRLS